MSATKTVAKSTVVVEKITLPIPPSAPGFMWVKCPNAVGGEAHFPCHRCAWRRSDAAE